jgi:hypothetical protein
MKCEAEFFNTVNNSLEDLLFNLFLRWKDECKYEDFKEYSKVFERELKEVLPEAIFQKASKRPFGIFFIFENQTINYFVKSKSSGYCASMLFYHRIIN